MASAFRVDHPTATTAMTTTEYESYPEELPSVTLSWAFNDADEPTQVTIFDSDDEITTHWITMDEEYVCDLLDHV